MIYLYVKQHEKTGLKYFGKTGRDPFKYDGSGIHWVRHIQKHGREHIQTIEVFEFLNQEDATEFALSFSELHNIVESKDWANMIPENALTGIVHTEETRSKISKANSTRIISPESYKRGAEKRAEKARGKKHSSEWKNNISAALKGKPNPRKGMPVSEETHKKLIKAAEAKRGIARKPEHIEKMKTNRKGKGLGKQSPEHIQKRIAARLATINRKKLLSSQVD